MAKLILSLDGVMLKEFPLTKERTTIGRKPHNDIPIENLAVSGEHAAIITILNDSFLEDLGSTNGTLVNGQPIKKHFLQNNDLIEIGKYKVKYVNEVVSTTTAADFEKTMVLRAPPRAQAGTNANAGPESGVPKSLSDTQINPPFAGRMPGGASMTPGTRLTSPGGAQGAAHPTLSPASQPPMNAGTAPPGTGIIQILSGSNAGRELPLTKALTTLGKPGVQVAVIAKRSQGYFITHVEGANSTVVNGKVLDAQTHPLSDHSIIELAGVKMEFFLKGA